MDHCNFSQTDANNWPYDPPIEPVYPLENAALFIYGGGVQAVRGLWTLGRGAYAGVRTAIVLRTAFSASERAIIRESATILSSAEFGAIRAAHAAGTSTIVNIGGRTIQYEAGVTVGNAMTNQAGNGFALFGGAFASEAELATAVATELFRLQSGTLGRAAAGGYAADATAAAYGFSERAAEYILAITR